VFRVPAKAALAAVFLLASLAGPGCTHSDDGAGVSCGDPAKVVSLANSHYPEMTCESATRFAEQRLTTAYYLKACQQLAPSAGLPSSVEAAAVLSCEPARDVPGFERGVVAQIEICCR
jgi:hypothetical protein